MLLPRVALLCFAVLRTAYSLDSIDILEPIVRTPPPSLDKDGYFGFSAVLHRVSPANPQGFDQYLQSSRIIVSAPNGSADNAMVDNTGVLFSCPITQLQDGTCQPLMGDGNGDDRFLYDQTPNERNTGGTDEVEDKKKQFLGVSMDSLDNMFIVCAHRYFYSPGSSRYPRGRCFYTTNRDLQGFQDYQPCEGLSTGRNNFGQCQAGSSVTLADENTNSDSTVVPILVGAPGSRDWEGAIFRRATNGGTRRTDGGVGTHTRDYSWQGYSMTKGHFLSTSREDLAVSVPRLNNYFGQVNIIINEADLELDGQTLQGTTQMGEYYGFSLAAVDLNGDGLDELLVGAPMYSPTGSPEAGQVYVYQNNQGTLQAFRQITAPINEQYARFGHAITNLGDINGDGLEDVAISAPFGTGSGKVYIYYGSVADTISQTVQQTIVGSEITELLSGGIEAPSGFGYSLTSSLDVDGNGINDLLVGAYSSQQVFLLRTRAVANVQVTLSAEPNIVNLQTDNCTLGGETYPCFRVTACATFPTGESFIDSTALDFKFIVDRRNNERGLQKRVFFDSPGGTTNKTVTRTFDRGERQCVTEIVYINKDISDRFNGFPVELSMTGPQFSPSQPNGNPNPSNLLGFPIVSIQGQTDTQVETFKDCNGQTCIPNLRLSHVNTVYETSSGARPTSFVAGQVTNFNINMTLTNARDDAFLTTISFSIPTAQFEFIRIEPRALLITCTSVVGNEETRLTCPIANPLPGGETRQIAVRLRPTSGLRPSEGPFEFNFTASSINPEVGTLQDNSILIPIDVAESADVYLDNAIADPEQLSYSTNITVGNLTSPEDLGPPVTVSYVIRNAGPSTVPQTKLRIFWPLRESESELYYLYPSQIQRSVSTTSTVDCEEDQYINQLGLVIQTATEGDQEDDGSFGSDGRRRRRRSISPLKRKKRSIRKRQSDPETVDEIIDISINCRSNPELCVEIVCTIRQLTGGSSIQVDIVSHLDERYFLTSTDRFTFVPYANVSIESSGISQPFGHLSDETEVQIRAVTSTPPPRRGDSSVAAWVIIVPIILGLLFFIILGVILYFVGFFRRKNKQKKEEIQAQFLEAQQGGDTFDDPPQVVS